MSLNETRCHVLALSQGEPDTKATADELQVEIKQAGRFSRGSLQEYEAAVTETVQGEMTAKTRSLFSLMIALSSSCESCTANMLSSAIRLGASRDEVKNSLRRGVLMAERPAMAVAAEALATFDAIKGAKPTDPDRQCHSHDVVQLRRRVAH